MKNKKPYKEPVFLFTSGSLRQAAYAGWYSALGEEERTKEFSHNAHSEWAKELGAGRRFSFLSRFNHDIYEKVDPEKLKKLVNKFLLDLKKEIKKAKKP